MPPSFIERALARRAAEPDRGHGDVQRRELVVGEPEVGQVVLLRVDPVAGLGVVADVADRHAHRAERGLVPLERPPGRRRVRRVAERRVGDEVVAGEARRGSRCSAASRFSSRSRRSGPSAVDGRCSIARRPPSGGRGYGSDGRDPGCGGALEEDRVVGRGPAHRADPQVVGGERREHVRDGDGHDVVARRDARGRRGRRGGRPRASPPSAGTGPSPGCACRR